MLSINVLIVLSAKIKHINFVFEKKKEIKEEKKNGGGIKKDNKKLLFINTDQNPSKRKHNIVKPTKKVTALYLYWHVIP